MPKEEKEKDYMADFLETVVFDDEDDAWKDDPATEVDPDDDTLGKQVWRNVRRVKKARGFSAGSLR